MLAMRATKALRGKDRALQEPQFVFDQLPGVRHTAAGYTGGLGSSPTYGSVCHGDGHTEAVRVEYDPSEISYEELLDSYWSQFVGPPAGKLQYRSVIWYHDDEQRRLAENSVRAAQHSGRYIEWQAKVPVEPAKAWHDAEEDHQHHFRKAYGCYKPGDRQ